MIDRPFLLQDRIPVIAELILLFLSGGNKAKIISMINDNRAKWILATAQTIEGINLLTQRVKNNAIISQKEAWQILFGNIRTIYVRDLFDIWLSKKMTSQTTLQFPLKSRTMRDREKHTRSVSPIISTTSVEAFRRSKSPPNPDTLKIRAYRSDWKNQVSNSQFNNHTTSKTLR